MKFHLNTHFFSRKFTLSLMALLFLVSITTCHHFITASSQAQISSEKSVISVRIHENDTLWSIAKKHYTEECGSIQDYIHEIKTSNSLLSDQIHAGNYIIVPIYLSHNDKSQS